MPERQPPVEELAEDVFDRLMGEIHRRAATLPPGSYTTKLIEGGVEKMGAKIMEEAAEIVDAAEKSPSPDNHHLIYEACDLIYHVWVLLGSRGISVDDLRNELSRREGTSGLEEKRQRQADYDR
ncbi:MAG: phosphoribosyl-ATP diphosphatase [Pirellulaceae bacterium]